MLRLKSDTLKFQSLSNEILILLNGNMSLKEIIDAVLKLIQQKMNISAVGMRLKVGDDFPYFSHVGFPEGLVVHSSLFFFLVFTCFVLSFFLNKKYL